MPMISALSRLSPLGHRGGGMDAGEKAIRDGSTVAWYDFTATSTLTDDGAGVISKWKDKLDSGHDLIASGTQRPTLGTTGITFNGTTNEMICADFGYEQPEMIYMVIDLLVWTKSKYIMDGTTAGGGLMACYAVSPRIRINAGSNILNDGFIIGEFGVVRALFNGANSKFWFNDSGYAIANVGTSDMGGITLGNYGGLGNLRANFIIKELVCRNVVDSEADEAAIYDYLKKKVT